MQLFLKSMILASAYQVVTLPAYADIPVDLTNSQLVRLSNDTFRIDNLKVPGAGTYEVTFKWNQKTISFEPIMEQVKSTSATCTRASGSTGSTYKNYEYRSRASADLEVGAITSASGSQASLLLTWAKTPTAATNPYLKGIKSENYVFDANKRYGIVGYAYSPIETGTPIEIIGSASEGSITIKSLTNANSIVLMLPASSVTQSECGSSASGVYSGNLYYSNSYKDYLFTTINSTTGSIINQSGGKFIANWDSSNRGQYAGLNYGKISAVEASAYPGFAVNDLILVGDIGDGLTFMTYNASTGAIKGATAFIR